jgi:single-strand DNA-binding protein
MYHQIVLVGRLGRDPEMRYLPNGNPVTNFSVATDRRYTDSNGEPVKETAWFRVSVFGKQAENCNNYLHKGSSVLVEGRLTVDPQSGGPRVWTRQDGTKGASFEVVANTVRFLSPRGEGGTEVEGATEGEEVDLGDGEDIPF